MSSSSTACAVPLLRWRRLFNEYEHHHRDNENIR